MKPNPQPWAGARYQMDDGDVIVLDVLPKGRGYTVTYCERPRSGFMGIDVPYHHREKPQEQFLRMVAGR